MASRHILRSRLSLAPIPFPRGFRSCAYVLDSSRLQRASRIPVGAVETSTASSEPQTTSTDVSKAPKTPGVASIYPPLRWITLLIGASQVPIDPNHVSIIKETLSSELLDITSPTLRKRIELHESSNEYYTRRLEQNEKFQDTLLKRIQQLEITASVMATINTLLGTMFTDSAGKHGIARKDREETRKPFLEPQRSQHA
jgi:hypothetical protein